jgi:DNA repair exonuclease SbcCD ATPase subunit
MILRRLRVEGFGTLHGEWHFDPARVNLLCGENERGKTTLAAAIHAALFGLEADRRGYRGTSTPLDHYRPWNGRPYAVELEFDARGKRYVVSRHFGNGKLTVLEDGRDATQDFRHGSGEYKVGEELLGLSGPEQFARTAVSLQPGPTRFGGEDVRPDGSLTTLLEGMASSVTGDASSTNAIRVLDEALRNYKGVAQTGMVANEIKKLQVALGTSSSDLKAAESDRAQLAESLQRLAEIEDTELRKKHALEIARRANQLRRRAELETALATDAQDRTRLALYKDELAKLEPARGFPKDAAQRLAQAQAEKEAAKRTLEQLAAQRREDLGMPRVVVEDTLQTLAAFAWAEPGHIEELAGVEKDLERVREQVHTAQAKRAELEKELAARGVSFERVSELVRRFNGLSGEDKTMLMQYPAQTQAIVVDGDQAQQSVRGASALIEQVGESRGRLRAFGLAAGVLGLLAGGVSVWFAINGRVTESFFGLGITLVALALAIVLLLRSASYRAAERAEALRQMLDAQRRLNDLKARRREREEMLEQLAQRLDFPDVTSLLREHSEHLRLTVESQRMGWLEEDGDRSHKAEQEAGEQVRAWAAKASLPASLPAHEALAKLRQGIGGVLEARTRTRELDQLERRIAAQEADAKRRLESAQAEAVEIAKKLGFDGDAAQLASRIEARAKDHHRLETLEKELIPGLAARALTDEQRASHRAEIERIKAMPAAAPEAGPVGDPDVIEKELEALRRERLDLVGKVGGRERESSSRIASLLGERDRFASALEKAKRFKEAVELARDRFQSVARETHARWSESLSGRVDELLTRFGLQHQSFQISEKLEPSLSLGGDRLTQVRLDQALSAGARDQLELALRLAICEYLATGGEKLPIVLDDPIATSDEDRTRRLFQTLTEAVRAGHQVVVLTCHRAKVEAAKLSDPAWFADSIAVTEMGPEAPRRNP